MGAAGHFIVHPKDAHRLDELRRARPGVDYPYWIAGRTNWAALSWLILREHREGMTLGDEPAPDRINFAHVQTWRALGPRDGEFRVSARADYPRLFDVDFEVVQNPAACTGPLKTYLPYWPVPGLIPRRVERRGVRTVGYAGFLGAANLAPALSSGAARLLGGLELKIIPPDRWHDLSELDVLLGVRLTGPPALSGKAAQQAFLVMACRRAADCWMG